MEFRVFFSSENGSERNSEVFSSENGLERNSKVLSFKNGLERNSKGFFLPRNGSERNSEVFLFRETGGIPTELPSVPSCFVFRGIIFLSENGNPIRGSRCNVTMLSSSNPKYSNMRIEGQRSGFNDIIIWRDGFPGATCNIYCSLGRLQLGTGAGRLFVSM